MSYLISKEEREAYNAGREEKEYIDNHPLTWLFLGGGSNRPDDPGLAAAYDKGIEGKQLDEDKK